MSDTDTIAAISTPPGRGGIAIVRISGPDCARIGAAIVGTVPPTHKSALRVFRDAHAQIIDHGVAIFSRAPHSFTGEDVLELQGHGSPVALDQLLERIYALGARPARPGEFSERAFLNDKLDLAQAEAIADLIDSHTRQAAQAALRSLTGEFSKLIDSLLEQLTELRVYVEAAIDFPDEDIDWLSEGHIGTRLEHLSTTVTELAGAATQGQLLRDGITVVIAGQPNAGKSSLLNALAQADVAIVTQQPGTTRDVLTSDIQMNGLAVTMVDTAGLRTGGDIVEQEGMRRAHERLQSADMALLVIDDQQGFNAEDAAIIDALPPALPVCQVWNKIDLTSRTPGHVADAAHTDAAIAVSAVATTGLDALSAHIQHTVGFHGGGDNISARRRHLESLARTREHLDTAQAHFATRTGELIAEELRLAQLALGEITGAVSSDDLLGHIFSSFCIGK